MLEAAYFAFILACVWGTAVLLWVLAIQMFRDEPPFPQRRARIEKMAFVVLVLLSAAVTLIAAMLSASIIFGEG